MRLKNILKALPIVLGLSVFASCEERDDISDRNRLYRLEDRVAYLEELCDVINKNNENIKKLLQEQAKKVGISSVYEMEKGGYVIAFTDGEFVELHDGKDGKNGEKGEDGKIVTVDGEITIPKIGVKIAEDGLHYWTLNGEWLLDENDKMVLAEGTKGDKGDKGQSGEGGGVTPLMKIENGNWMVSYDKGKTWEIMGPATGADGKDGICPELRIENGMWYISYDNGETWEAIGSAVGEDGKTPSLKIENGDLMISYDGGTTWTIVEGSNGQFGPNGGGTSGGVTVAGHTSVDLGLPSGKKWASCNVGANRPEEYGQYYAWGDTALKSEFSPNTCITFGKTTEMLAYQNYISAANSTLTSTYDIAQIKWGDGWRMPTRAEFEELIDNCNWTWTKVGTVYGYIVESKAEGNTNSIFLPAAGMKEEFISKNEGTQGSYWSSNPFGGGMDYLSYDLEFSEKKSKSISTASRRCGFPIRPIFGE